MHCPCLKLDITMVKLHRVASYRHWSGGKQHKTPPQNKASWFQTKRWQVVTSPFHPGNQRPTVWHLPPSCAFDRTKLALCLVGNIIFGISRAWFNSSIQKGSPFAIAATFYPKSQNPLPPSNSFLWDESVINNSSTSKPGRLFLLNEQAQFEWTVKLCGSYLKRFSFFIRISVIAFLFLCLSLFPST